MLSSPGASARYSRVVTDHATLRSWWEALTPEQQRRAHEIAIQSTPRGMPIDDLVASMAAAGIPTSRMVWTGTPEFLAEMLDDVAEFVANQP